MAPLRPNSWPAWLRGLATAFISGSANCICAVVIDPVTFNPQEQGGLGKLLMFAAYSGIINLFFYLKQSPLPDNDE